MGAQASCGRSIAPMAVLMVVMVVTVVISTCVGTRR